MALVDKLTEDLKSASKAKDEVAVSVLRLLIANINNAKIAKGSDLTDDDVLAEIAKDAKRHKESIAAYKKAERGELAEKEEKELGVLEKYLPEQVGEDEVCRVVDEVVSESGATSMADMGKVMGQVMGKLKGQADGNVVSAIVKEKLSAK